MAFSPSDLEDGHWFMRRRTVLLLFQSRFDGSVYSRLRNFHYEGTHGLRGVPFLTVQDRAFYQHGVRLAAVGALTSLTVHPFHNTISVSLVRLFGIFCLYFFNTFLFAVCESQWPPRSSEVIPGFPAAPSGRTSAGGSGLGVPGTIINYLEFCTILSFAHFYFKLLNIISDF